MSTAAPVKGSHAYRWLLVVPFVWQVGLAPAVNGIAFSPWHIPFPMAWQMLGVAVTSVVIAVVFRLDRRAGVEAEEADFLASTERPADLGGEH
jgi:uncharacterized membrane protein